MGHGSMPGGRATMALYTSRTTTQGKARDFGNELQRTEAGDKLLTKALVNSSAEVLRWVANNRRTADHVAAMAAKHGAKARDLGWAIGRVALGFGG